MMNIDVNSLKQFDLNFPGIWINGDNPDHAFQIRHVLGLIQSLFVEAVASYALFQPITAQGVRDLTDRDESPYERCLNGLYAKAFVFALQKDVGSGLTLCNSLVGETRPWGHVQNSINHYFKLNRVQVWRGN
jgi:hypothetical protein